MKVKSNEQPTINPHSIKVNSRGKNLRSAVSRILDEPASEDFGRHATRERSDGRDDLRHDLRTMAIGYAKKGWAVVPLWSRAGDACGCGDPNCGSPGKHPIGQVVPHGLKDATTDAKVVESWYKKFPDAGIGLVTGAASGILVLDVDIKRAATGSDGEATLALLEAELGKLPQTQTVSTPSGGRHYYFRHVEGVGSSVEKLGPGVDVRGDGGMIVAPPSHGMYRFARRASPAELPTAWTAHLNGLTTGGTAGPNATADPDRIAAALRAIPNHDLPWDEWNRIGMATWRATGGDQRGFVAFDEWSRKSGKYVAETTRLRWGAISKSPPSIIGAGTIFYLAKESPAWAEALDRDERLDALAQLSPIEYGQRRKVAAKALGISVKILDDEISRRRKSRKPEKSLPAPELDVEKLGALAKPIIDCEDVLSLFVEEFSKRIAGETKSGRLLYLIATTRLFEKTMHVAIKGTSAGGKSQLRQRVLDFIPPEDVIPFTALSDKALLYFESDFSHKILSMGEAMVGKEQEFQDTLLRQLMSENRLVYLVPRKTADGSIVTTTVEKNGPVVFMVTTARNRLYHENETRMLSIEINDSEEQTKAIMRKIAVDEGLNQQEAANLDPWIAYQRLLKTGERRVYIPFMDVLAELIPARAVRLRRDISQLVLAIKAHAFLHRAHRERNDRGEIVATLKDYNQVRKLMGDLLSVASEVKQSSQVRETIEAIDAIIEELGLHLDYTEHNDGKGVTIREVAARLKLDISSARRRIRAAEDQGLVVNVNKHPGPGRRALYRTVADLSTMDRSERLLPTVEEMVQRERGWD